MLNEIRSFCTPILDYLLYGSDALSNQHNSSIIIIITITQLTTTYFILPTAEACLKAVSNANVFPSASVCSCVEFPVYPYSYLIFSSFIHFPSKLSTCYCFYFFFKSLFLQVFAI